jgi:flagellar biosynthesis protein FliQ
MGSITVGLPQATLNVLEGTTFLPNAIASPFMTALTTAFVFGALLCFIAAAFSALRGKKYVYKTKETPEK